MSLRRVLHTNCLPALRIVADQLSRAAFSTSAASSTSLQQTPEDSLFVGAYTPVTKQLWQDRLKMAQQQSADPGAAAAKDAMEARPPKQTVVKYPFTTDRVLLELVSTLLWALCGICAACFLGVRKDSARC